VEPNGDAQRLTVQLQSKPGNQYSPRKAEVPGAGALMEGWMQTKLTLYPGSQISEILKLLHVNPPK
jgi:hypothetical protein